MDRLIIAAIGALLGAGAGYFGGWNGVLYFSLGNLWGAFIVMRPLRSVS